jgi:hypothetical protein
VSRKAIPVDACTRDRLRAYTNRHLLEALSYDDGVNELLDGVEFPTMTEIDRDYSVVWDAVPRFREVNAADADARSSNHPGRTGPMRARKSIPVTEPTRDRLLAYSNRHFRTDQSYDEAVNELLDWVAFPTAEEIYRHFSVIWDITPLTREELAEVDGFTPNVRARPALARGE